MIFQGMRTSISTKPIFFVIFQRGTGPPVPPSGSAHGKLYSKFSFGKVYSQIYGLKLSFTAMSVEA